jgi:hypothetical protein
MREIKNVSATGLWTAEFSTGSDAGAGVVVFTDGKVLGGDNRYYYDGTYSQQGAFLHGEIVAKHYSGPPRNVFGSFSSVRLILEGSIGGDLIVAYGYDPSAPQRRLSIRLRRVKSL